MEMMSNELNAEALVEIRQRVDAAWEEVVGLANGSRKWTMCVPVQATDSDEVLAAPLGDIEKLLGRIDVLTALVRELETELDAVRLLPAEDSRQKPERR